MNQVEKATIRKMMKKIYFIRLRAWSWVRENTSSPQILTR